ncbi:MAG TPA: MFS transporter, partial [Chitinophaga sp.]
IPIGLLLAGKAGWHMPFLMIVGLCLVIGIAIMRGMQPMREHLQHGIVARPLAHLRATAAQPRYQYAFLTTVFLATGGFLMMPYASNFLVHNVGIAQDHLFMIYIVAGAAGLVVGPLIGKWSDKTGKYNMFIGGTLLAIVMVLINTHLGVTPLWLVLVLNTLMMTAVNTRMIPSQALISAVPDLKDRGAFMSINASVQQLGGGIAAAIGGAIVTAGPSGQLHHYDTIGYVTIFAFVLCAGLMYLVNETLRQKQAGSSLPAKGGAATVLE